MANIRWGIIGAGNIAKQFSRGLTAVADHDLVAIASRSQEKADAFGDEFSIPKRYASYEAMAADPDIDAVYVATPHTSHREHSILCLEHGKAVLCEKPFTINAKDTQAIVDVARAKGVFLMEAMWTRFLPATVKVRELLAAGAIGDVLQFQGDFGFRAGVNPEGRLFNPALGGGGLLDVGIYPIAYAAMVFGKQPNRIAGLAEIGSTGVDEQNAVVFGYEGGGIAICSSAVRTNTQHMAVIYGTEGRIEVPTFWKATEIRLTAGGKTETIACPMEGNGYNYEAIEVGNCLRAGKLESDVISLDESLAIMGTLDAIRAQWGLSYPGE